MKLVRGSLFFVSVILFFISLFLGNIFLTLFSSLEYESVSPNISFSVNEILEENYNFSYYLENNYSSFVDYCSSHEYFLYNYSLIYANIPCEIIVSGANETLKFISDENPTLNNLALLDINSDLILRLDYMQEYCLPHISYYSKNIKMNVSCENIRLGKEETRDFVLNNFVDEIYYKDYDCNFWDCASKTGSTFFLVSEKAFDYWKSKFYLSVLISLALLIVIYFLLEEKLNLFFILGGSFILSSLPLLKIESFLIFLFTPFIKWLNYFNYLDSSIISSVLSIFFSKAYFVFKIIFGLGIFFVFLGVVLYFWSSFTGRTKRLFSKKEVEEIVNSQIKKANKKKLE